MKFRKYINENKAEVEKIKKQIKDLENGKLTVQGKKKIELLKDKLHMMGVFDV